MTQTEMIDALAQEARRASREAQLVLDGQLTYGGATPEWPHPKTRFSLVARMNRTLKDPQSTYALFASPDTTRPEYAERVSGYALEEIVAAGDFALGERYSRDPVGQLERVNEAARTLPMFPPPGEAPRLSAELGNFAKDLRLRTAILRGSGCRANWPRPAPYARRSSPIRWRRTPGAHVLIEPDKKAEQPIWKPSA